MTTNHTKHTFSKQQIPINLTDFQKKKKQKKKSDRLISKSVTLPHMYVCAC